MRVLLLNQTFYPDTASSAQHATDLAASLVKAGHQVVVLTSRRAYDSPSLVFARNEIMDGVRILRLRSTSFGKSAHWRRALDFASFYLSCALQLMLLPRCDVVVAMTSPPLISFLAGLYVRVKGGSLLSWILDLNPDEAIAAGALDAGSLLARVMARLLQFSLSSSATVVALDRFMRDRLVAKGVPDRKILVLPPWAHDGAVRYDQAARVRFRTEHGIADRFVVMYSGNHSPCHPLNTLLGAARELSAERNVVFVFVGGGSQFQMVREFASRNSLGNVLCLPCQPLEGLAGSLSAADLHVAVMGDAFVGIVHPCKIYNILATGCPYLYVGPSPSHITEIARTGATDSAHYARHGDIASVASVIRAAAARGRRRCPAHHESARRFSTAALVSRLVAAIERMPLREQSPNFAPELHTARDAQTVVS